MFVTKDVAGLVNYRSILPNGSGSRVDKYAWLKLPQNTVGVSTYKYQDFKNLLQALELSYGAEALRYYPAKLLSPLIINLGDGIDNSGTSLERHTRQPYIPGSGFKGVVASVARTEIEGLKHTDAAKAAELQQAYDFIFGKEADSNNRQNSGSKGWVSFLPAYPDNDANCIQPEIATPHANDNPVPIIFPSVQKGTSYLFIVVATRQHAQREGYMQQLDSWIRAALQDHGIGAKTAAGYGWFSIDDSEKDKIALARQREADKLAAQRQLQQASPLERYVNYVKALLDSNTSEDQVAQLLGSLEQQVQDLCVSRDRNENYIKLCQNFAQLPQECQQAVAACWSAYRKEKNKKWKEKNQDLHDVISAFLSSNPNPAV